MVETAGNLFTPPARAIVEDAEDEARRGGYPLVGVNILRALRRSPAPGVRRALDFAGLTRPPDGPSLRLLKELSPEAAAGQIQDVYGKAVLIAEARGMPAVEPEDLLSAVVIDPSVVEQLKQEGHEPAAFREAVEASLAAGRRKPPRRAAKTAKAAPLQTAVVQDHEAEQRLETVPTHADRPAQVDLLGRRRLAQVLAERLRRIRGENTDSPDPRGPVHSLRRRLRRWLRSDGPAPTTPREEGAFLVHLHAPWGAGKTTLLNFLRQELSDPDDPDLVPWVVVDFSAWRHQRVPPPWWWLLSAMRNEGLRSLWRTSAPRAVWFWIRDLLWRIGNARFAWLPIVIGGALVAVAFAVDPLELSGKTLSEAQITIGAIAAILGFAVTVWGLIRGISGWLLVGSAPIGSRVLQRVHDPLRMIHRRFRFLVRQFHRPVAVFIDDLDRCDPEYVVELLEGIQTLFMDEPVSYVIAADRRWVCDSYAKVYEGFEQSVGQPGRPLGYLFLEKTFQLSFELPPMPRDRGEDLWRSLVSTAAPELPQGFETPTGVQELPSGMRRRWLRWARRFTRRAKSQTARTVFAAAETEAEVLEILEEAPAELAEEWREAAARRLGSAGLERALQHMLQPFYPLLENNPRGMKRLVNAYGLERARHVRDGTVLDDEARLRLVLWTIVRLRWPLLAERLCEDPGLVDAIRADDDPEEADELTPLLRHPDVRNVFNGADPEAELDLAVDLTRDDVFGFAAGTSGTRPAVGA
jgi:hypothetical protein